MQKENTHLPLVSRDVKAWRDEHLEEQQVAVVAEEPLLVSVNGRRVAALMRLPGNERELAAGFLVSEGIIPDFSAIYTILHCNSEADTSPAQADQVNATGRNRVDVQAAPERLNPEARLDVLRLVRAGCGAAEVNPSVLQHAPLASAVTFDARVLAAAAKGIRDGQAVHMQAGGTHAAGIYSRQGECIVLREDIGRHNAVDKACGYCLLNMIPLDDKLLLCSGRLSYEMVNKALNLGIQVVASISSPTELALQLADVGNVTVVGYLRGSRMTVYTHPERIIFPADGTLL